MRVRELVAAAAVLLLTAVPGHATEQEVEQTAKQIQSAVEARDTAMLERLVHPSFHMLHGLGQIERRDGWLALVRAGRLPRQTVDRREYGVTVHMAGATGVRTGIVRFRDRKTGRDQWLRGTATFIREAGGWRQLWQQSSFLGDTAIADLEGPGDFVGTYTIPGRDGFQISERDGLLVLQWPNLAELPLIPQGGDRFGSGPTSHMTFARDVGGAVTGVTRVGPDGPWWTATRTAAGGQN